MRKSCWYVDTRSMCHRQDSWPQVLHASCLFSSQVQTVAPTAFGCGLLWPSWSPPDDPSSPRSSGHMACHDIMIKLCLLTFWSTFLCLSILMAVRWWFDCVSDFRSFWTKASAKRPKHNNVKYWWTNTAWTDEQSVTAWTKSHFLLLHTFSLWVLLAYGHWLSCLRTVWCVPRLTKEAYREASSASKEFRRMKAWGQNWIIFICSAIFPSSVKKNTFEKKECFQL